jgi:hypothetical protein
MDLSVCILNLTTERKAQNVLNTRPCEIYKTEYVNITYEVKKGTSAWKINIISLG